MSLFHSPVIPPACPAWCEYTNGHDYIEGGEGNRLVRTHRYTVGAARHIENQQAVDVEIAATETAAADGSDVQMEPSRVIVYGELDEATPELAEELGLILLRAAAEARAIRG